MIEKFELLGECPCHTCHVSLLLYIYAGYLEKHNVLNGYLWSHEHNTFCLKYVPSAEGSWHPRLQPHNELHMLCNVFYMTAGRFWRRNIITRLSRSRPMHWLIYAKVFIRTPPHDSCTLPRVVPLVACNYREDYEGSSYYDGGPHHDGHHAEP